MGFKDVKDILEILGISASPTVLLAIGWFIYAGHQELKILKRELAEIKSVMYNNGFVRKAELAEAKKHADDTHDEMYRRLEDHEDWIRKLAIKVDS